MTNIKHVNSVVDRDFRNRINQLIDVVNSVGITIDELVVKGVMTTEQYSELITSINGLVKIGEVSVDALSDELKNEVEKINNKVDKGNISVSDINKNLGKIDQTFLSDELLQQIAGTAPVNAVVADGSVTTSKVSDLAITKSKTDFIKTSNNLLGKELLLYAKIPDSTGKLIYQNARNTSHLIKVKGLISFTGVIALTQYDSNKSFIKQTTYTSGTKNTLTLEANTEYIRATVTDTFLETCQLNLGSTLLPYENYVKNELTKNIEPEKKSVKKEHVDFVIPAKLILNKDKLKPNILVISSGVETTHNSYSASDYIEYDNSKNYSFRGVDRVSIFNSNKEFVENHNLLGTNTYTMSFNDLGKYFRVSVHTDYINDFKLNEGISLLSTNEVDKAHIDPDLIKLKDKSVEVKHLSDDLIGTGKPLNTQLEIFKTIVMATPRYDLPMPMLVMTYDDNPVTDYTLAFPVHQAHNVPGEIATISGFLLDEVPAAHPQPSMTIEQLEEMYEFGFEVSTHTYSHLNLGAVGLTSNVLVGDKHWYVGNQHTFNRRFPYWARVYHRLGDRNYEEIKIIGEGNDGERNYLISESPAKFNHTELGSTVFSLTDAELYKEIVYSNQQLNKLGFNSNSIAYPYNSNSIYSRAIAQKYLTSGRAGNANKSGIYMDSTNDYIPTFALKSYAEITTWTHSEIDTLLQEVKDNNALATVFEHTWRKNFSPDGLDYIFTKCKELGIKVVTRTEALKHHGNRFEFGDYLRDYEAYRGTEPNYVINAYGKEFKDIKR